MISPSAHHPHAQREESGLGLSAHISDMPTCSPRIRSFTSCLRRILHSTMLPLKLASVPSRLGLIMKLLATVIPASSIATMSRPLACRPTNSPGPGAIPHRLRRSPGTNALPSTRKTAPFLPLPCSSLNSKHVFKSNRSSYPKCRSVRRRSSPLGESPSAMLSFSMAFCRSEGGD